MKVLVDYDLCEGNALCVAEAPEVFTVDDNDYVQLLINEPGPELAAKVKEAVRRCPRMALSLAE